MTSARPRRGPHDDGIDERVVTIAGERTRVLSVGGADAERPTVLMFHGYTDCADTWRPTLDRLAGSGVYAVALDMPQFGTTTRSTRRDLGAWHAEAVAATITRFDSGSGVVLVGNSFGGWDAIRGALDPDLPVHAVVAVSPVGMPTRGVVGVARRYQAALRLTTRGRPVLPSTRVSRALAGHVLGAVYARAASTERLPADVARRYRSHIQGGDLRLWISLSQSIIAEVTAPGALDLSTLDRPVHLIWGTRDVMVTHQGARWAREASPDHVTVELLDGVGHCAQLQRPGVVADAVLRMVETSAAAGAGTDRSDVIASSTGAQEDSR